MNRKRKMITVSILSILMVILCFAPAAHAAVRLSAKSVVVAVGKSTTISVKGTSRKVKWSVNRSKIATVKNGKITGVMAGKTVVTAKVGSTTLTCNVRVENPKLNVRRKVLLPGQSVKLQVKGLKTKQKVTWSIGQTKIATLKNGVVTAKSEGLTYVTAKVLGVKLYCRIIVENPSINKKSATLAVGVSTKLKINNLKTDQNIVWSVGKPSVAAVKNGKVTAKGKGSTYVTATLLGKKFKCKITVVDPKLDQTKISIYPEEMYEVNVLGLTLPSDKKLTWKSSNYDIAGARGSGSQCLSVFGRGLKPGTVTISTEIYGKTLSCKVTVKSRVASAKNLKYVNRSYKDESTGETLITYKVPVGWEDLVMGIRYGVTEPSIIINPPEDMNFLLQYNFSSVILKNSKAKKWYQDRDYPYGSLAYVIPADGFSSTGKDTAGVYLGFAKYESTPAFKITNHKIIKKLGSSTWGGDSLYCSLSINGRKYNEIFSARVLNGFTYPVSAGDGKSIDAGVYAVYNLITFRAPANKFEEWLPVLNEIYSSIKFTDAMFKRFADEQEVTLSNAKESYKLNSDWTTRMVNNYSNYIRQ